MRMNTGGAAESIRPFTYQVDGGSRARKRAARNDDSRHAGRVGSRDHLVAIVVETVVREIRSNIHQSACGSSHAV